MGFVWLILSVCMVVIGIVGCVIPVMPGPILSYCGILCLLFSDKPPSVVVLVVFGVVAAIVSILDYTIPMIGTKQFKGSKLGALGALVGTVVGLLFFPVGLIFGPFLGALIGELLTGKQLEEATMCGVGSLLGFLASTIVKIIFCCTILVYIIIA